MQYLTNLKWISQLDEFSEETQKVLMALSHNQYKWRTKNRLLSATGLEPYQLDEVLANLIKSNLVRPSFSKNKELIFGLRERVD